LCFACYSGPRVYLSCAPVLLRIDLILHDMPGACQLQRAAHFFAGLNVKSNGSECVITKVARFVLYRGRNAADNVTEIPKLNQAPVRSALVSCCISLALGIFGPAPSHNDLLIITVDKTVLTQSGYDTRRSEFPISKVAEGATGSRNFDSHL